jgi:hypothetical protein
MKGGKQLPCLPRLQIEVHFLTIRSRVFRSNAPNLSQGEHNPRTVHDNLSVRTSFLAQRNNNTNPHVRTSPVVRAVGTEWTAQALQSGQADLRAFRPPAREAAPRQGDPSQDRLSFSYRSSPMPVQLLTGREFVKVVYAWTHTLLYFKMHYCSQE